MGRSGFESVSGLRTKSAGSNEADDRCKLGAKSDKNKRCQRHDISLPVEPSVSSQSSFRSRLSSSAQAPNTNPDSRPGPMRLGLRRDVRLLALNCYLLPARPSYWIIAPGSLSDIQDAINTRDTYQPAMLTTLTTATAISYLRHGADIVFIPSGHDQSS